MFASTLVLTLVGHRLARVLALAAIALAVTAIALIVADLMVADGVFVGPRIRLSDVPATAAVAEVGDAVGLTPMGWRKP